MLFIYTTLGKTEILGIETLRTRVDIDTVSKARTLYIGESCAFGTDPVVSIAKTGLYHVTWSTSEQLAFDPKLVALNYFCDDNGFIDEDLAEIAALEVDEVHRVCGMFDEYTEIRRIL